MDNQGTSQGTTANGNTSILANSLKHLSTLSTIPVFSPFIYFLPSYAWPLIKWIRCEEWRVLMVAVLSWPCTVFLNRWSSNKSQASLQNKMKEIETTRSATPDQILSLKREDIKEIIRKLKENGRSEEASELIDSILSTDKEETA